MSKKLWMAVLAGVFAMGLAQAAVDVNTADLAALEALKGIGAVKAKAILDERQKNGPYKSASDLAARVPGLGEKSVAKLQGNGLLVGGGKVQAIAKDVKEAKTVMAVQAGVKK